AVEPDAQPAGLYRAVTGPPALLDRTAAGRFVRAERACADGADLPPLALYGDGAGHPEHGRAISRRGPRPPFVPGFCRDPQHPARSGGARRFRTVAARRAFDRVLDRRCLLAPGDVATLAQAD